MRLGSKDSALLVQSAVAMFVLSTVALLDFYAANARELTSVARVVHYAEATVAVAAFVAGCLALLLRRIPLWRVLLATGLMIFVFYSYHAIETVQWVPRAHRGGWLPLLWLAITIAGGALALTFLRRPEAASVLLASSIAFSSPSLIRIAGFALAKEQTQTTPGTSGAPAAKNRISPNIYWIVLDGYPRLDVLQEEFAFDNSPFIRSLASLGFAVLGRSRSNFPATINSISSTLNMDYTVQGSGETSRAFPMKDLYPIVRGKNRTVARLRAMGYSYVHFENGYDYLTECGPDQPHCVRGNLGLDELDIAILANTPINDLVVYWQKLKDRLHSTPFALGGVDDLTSRLGEIRATPSPFFVYAHILAPHPPIRFRSDCSYRPAAPDLQGWHAASRPAFIEQLECINAQTLTLLQNLLQYDAKALVIVQSDHGTAFNGQFGKAAMDWSEADLHERFGVLNALRLPEQCRENAAADLTLVDTFPLAFSCLSGGAFERHPARFFVTPYENSPDFGRAIEYGADRLH